MVGRWAKIFVDFSIFFGSLFSGIAYIVSPGKRKVAKTVSNEIKQPLNSFKKLDQKLSQTKTSSE